jgi:putative transposase
MPNHFHFLIQANSASVKAVKETPIKINATSEAFRLMLSSYTKAIQKQELLTGNLFQQKTKARCVDEYATVAFHYIHQNALRAKLVRRAENWRWSSLPEYIGSSCEAICNKEIAYRHFGLSPETVLAETYATLPAEFVRKIF